MCFMKKGLVGNSTKFTGLHLCQSLFFNKFAGLRSRAPPPTHLMYTPNYHSSQIIQETLWNLVSLQHCFCLFRKLHSKDFPHLEFWNKQLSFALVKFLSFWRHFKHLILLFIFKLQTQAVKFEVVDVYIKRYFMFIHLQFIFEIFLHKWGF